MKQLPRSSDSPTPPRQLAREIIANLISRALETEEDPDATAGGIMEVLERQHLAIFPTRTGDHRSDEAT